MATAMSPAGVNVESVSMRVIPARGTNVSDAVRAMRADGIEELSVRENEALVTIFKRKPARPAIELADGVLYFRCAVNPALPTLAINLEAGIVYGPVRTLVIFDTATEREWSRSHFMDALDLSGGGVLTITQES